MESSENEKCSVRWFIHPQRSQSVSGIHLSWPLGSQSVFRVAICIFLDCFCALRFTGMSDTVSVALAPNRMQYGIDGTPIVFCSTGVSVAVTAVFVRPLGGSRASKG